LRERDHTLKDPAAVTTISVPGDANDIGISPASLTVYFTMTSAHSDLVPIDVATSRPGKPRHFNEGSLTVAVASGSG
jgi:hypothetical protein